MITIVNITIAISRPGWSHVAFPLPQEAQVAATFGLFQPRGRAHLRDTGSSNRDGPGKKREVYAGLSNESLGRGSQARFRALLKQPWTCSFLSLAAFLFERNGGMRRLSENLSIRRSHSIRLPVVKQSATRSRPRGSETHPLLRRCADSYRHSTAA